MEKKIDIFRLHFEVRYKEIINFSNQYRDAISAFTKLANVDFSITNTDSISEQIAIKFNDYSYSIDIWWDRIFIVVEGFDHKFDRSNGTMKNFFEILEIIKRFSGFGFIRTSILKVWAIEKISKEYSEIVKNFNENYLPTTLQNISDLELNDHLIQIVSGPKDKRVFLEMGPFNEEDIQKHKLVSITPKLLLELKSIVGHLYTVQISSASDSVTFADFKSKFETVNNYLNKMSL